jgi:HAD superfamily hydrolase (TIGR01509 family)
MAASRRFDAVFFDLGLTLICPRSFDGMIAETCGRHGIPLTPEEVARCHAGIDEEMAAFPIRDTVLSIDSAPPEECLQFWLALFRRILNATGRAYPDHMPRTLYEEQLHPSRWPLYLDMLPALTALRAAGVRLGVISNWETWCEQLIVQLELSRLLDFALISGTLGVEKPDPRLFRLALERAGVPAERAVHVGDDPARDCAGAHGVGITPVLLDRYGRHPAAPWPRLPDLTGFPAWIFAAGEPST